MEKILNLAEVSKLGDLNFLGCKGSRNRGNREKNSKMISSAESHSSYYCESISGFESTIGDTSSSLNYIHNLKE